MSASPHDEQHDLLPAYVAGTLAPDVSGRFREHLDACLVCRREVDFMRQVEAGAAAHGDDFFADHPEVDDIVALATGEDVGVADDAVARHVALCAACAAEVSWVRGDTSPVAGMSPTATASRSVAAGPRWSGRLGWIAAAAAIVALALTLTLRQGADGLEALGGSTFIADLEAATLSAETNVVAVPGWADSMTLTVLVDVAPNAFPTTVEVLDAAGRVLITKTVKRQADLEAGEFAAVTCGVALCRPGEHAIRIAAGTPAEHRIPFRVEPAGD